LAVIPLRRSAASAGQKDLSAFKIAPAMGTGVTDPVEMLEAFEASQKTRCLKRPLRAA
jgi:hypothetical protein